MGDALRDGRLPLWNPFQLNGHPWLATLQGGLLYPFHALYAWLPVYTGMAVSSLLHLGVAAAGAAAFVRRLGLSVWAALLAALLVATQGRLPGHAGVPNLLEAGAWLAPGAAAVASIVHGASLAGVALLAASLGLGLLAGYPQYTVYCCYAWAALLGCLLLADRRPLREWRRPASLFSAGIVIGLLLGSPQLLASLELNALSTRAGEAATHTQMFPMGWPKHSVVESLRLLAAGQPTWSPFGVATLVLAPFALASPRLQSRRQAIALLALLLVVFGMALGPVSPLFELYRLLPGVGSFRLPTQRLMLVGGFLAAVLAAFGLDALVRRVGARAGERAAAVLAGVVVATAFAEPFLDDRPRPELPYTGRGYEEIYERRQQIYDQVTSDTGRVVFWNPGIPPKLPSKLGAVFGMRVFDDYEPLSLRRQAQYFGYLRRGSFDDAGAPPFFGRFVPPRSPAEIASVASRGRLLDLAAVRWLLATNQQRHDVGLHAFGKALGYRREPAREKLWEVSPVLYVNDRALPRAYATYHTRPAPPAAQLLPALAEPSFDPLQDSYVEEGPSIGAGSPARRGHPVRIVREDANEVELSATLVAEGVVVLADSWFPGWEATVDGEASEVFPVNHLFRGVRVPAGEHVVRFRYRPSWLPLAGVGLALGFVGLLVLVRAGRGGDDPQST